MLNFPAQMYPEYLSAVSRNALLLGILEERCVSAVRVTVRVNAEPCHLLGATI